MFPPSRRMRQEYILSRGNLFADDHIDPAVSLEHHQGSVHRGVSATDHGNLMLFVVADLGYFVVDLFRVELIENGQLSWVVQQSARDDDFATKIGTLVRHESFQRIIFLYLIGVFRWLQALR